tara:strand:- start:681 stop:959 length:279 start_codon:yes stop_codon:yes gene_type:complete
MDLCRLFIKRQKRKVYFKPVVMIRLIPYNRNKELWWNERDYLEFKQYAFINKIYEKFYKTKKIPLYPSPILNNNPDKISYDYRRLPLIRCIF